MVAVFLIFGLLMVVTGTTILKFQKPKEKQRKNHNQNLSSFSQVIPFPFKNV